jgi:hypothetical protein
MKPHLLRVWAMGLAVAASVLWCQPVPAQDRNPNNVNPAAGTEPSMEVQGRGPVHEGFAQPMSDAKPGPIIPKQPPPPVPEEPSTQKPDGDVQWVPGYWGWDADKNDFLWVSGFWRKPPIGRKWVPGHWGQADNGYQWTSGFWADAAQPDVQYLQQPPPASVEEGPSVPAPDDNSLWVAGSWYWRDGQYVWRPGYWAVPQNGYVWTPPNYYYTPAGYVYTSGYWDYDLYDRGLLFAPVYFNSYNWYPGWYYRPFYAVRLAELLSSFWIGRGHYWFGDYYGGYRGFGLRPWFAFGSGRFYDPLFAYYRWSNRGNFNGWFGGLRNTFNGRVNGTVAIPPRVAGVNVAGRNSLVAPMNSLSNVRLTTTTANQIAAQRTTTQRFNQVAQQRSQLERVGANVGSQSRLSLQGVPGHTISPSVTSRANVGVGVTGGASNNARMSNEFRGSTSRYTPPFENRGGIQTHIPQVTSPSITRPSVTMPSTSSFSRPSFGGSFSGAAHGTVGGSVGGHFSSGGHSSGSGGGHHR